jgi:tetratricopeptide (TPR) repeat protein
MKFLRLFSMLIIFAACQPTGQEQKTAVITDSLSTAIANMRTDLQVNPTNAELRNTLANALIENNQLEAADSQAIILAKDTQHLDKAYYIKALIAFNKKDDTATLAYLAKVIALKGKNSEYEAVMMAGDLLLDQHAPDKAINYYALAWEIDSTQAEPVYGTAVCNEQMGNEKQARLRYMKTVELDPAYSPAYIGLGNIMARQRNWQEAWRYYNLAAKAEPTVALNFYSRGRAFLMLGNKPAGLDDLTKALSFKKDYPEAKALLDSALANNFK